MYILNNSKIIKSKIQSKNIYPILDSISNIPALESCNVVIGDVIRIQHGNYEYQHIINQIAKSLKPWRKGPFQICDTTIDSEWDSSIKFNIIKQHLQVKDKIVGDIGCNNGYYMFRMMELKPQKIIGFDPSAHYMCQFRFINHFINSDIKFELLGIEDLVHYDTKFDVIVCLGVLYHRMNPIECLKILKMALNKGGEIIIDSLIIESNEPIVLSPMRYAKMKNVYFIPSIPALKNWLVRAGFTKIDIVSITKTKLHEQRKTEWIDGQSLNDFLDSNDNHKTIEGFQAPTRAYIKAR